jgi:hypothetical protein
MGSCRRSIEALRLESLMCAGGSASRNHKTFDVQDSSTQAQAWSAVEGPILTWATNIDRQISGPFAGGKEISVADSSYFIVAGWLKRGVLDQSRGRPLTSQLEGALPGPFDHPKVVEWYGRTA